MALLVVIALAFLHYSSVCFRIAVWHPIKTVRNAAVDLYKYLKYRKWNNCKTGELLCFIGLFGKGKTLSAVRYIVEKYEQYNNKKVYDFDRKKWVTQRVHIISNVELALPYEKFVSLSQLVVLSELWV